MGKRTLADLMVAGAGSDVIRGFLPDRIHDSDKLARKLASCIFRFYAGWDVRLTETQMGRPADIDQEFESARSRELIGKPMQGDFMKRLAEGLGYLYLDEGLYKSLAGMLAMSERLEARELSDALKAFTRVLGKFLMGGAIGRAAWCPAAKTFAAGGLPPFHPDAPPPGAALP